MHGRDLVHLAVGPLLGGAILVLGQREAAQVIHGHGLDVFLSHLGLRNGHLGSAGGGVHSLSDGRAAHEQQGDQHSKQFLHNEKPP